MSTKNKPKLKKGNIMSIIPGLYEYVEENIISYLDYDSKVNLSLVSKTAYQVLSNDGFFKGDFMKNCPFYNQIDSNARVGFERFCIAHPANCWKVAGCVIRYGLKGFSRTFLKDNLAFWVNHLNQQKIQMNGNGENNALTTATHDLKIIDEILNDLKLSPKGSAIDETLRNIEKELFYDIANFLLKRCEYLSLDEKSDNLDECAAAFKVFAFSFQGTINRNYIADLAVFLATSEINPERKQKLYKALFYVIVEAFASQSLLYVTEENCNEQVAWMRAFFQSIPREFIISELANALSDKHGELMFDDLFGL
jgi:hypothetical protein